MTTRRSNSPSINNKGPIFVTGADGEKGTLSPSIIILRHAYYFQCAHQASSSILLHYLGSAIVRTLLEIQVLHSQLEGFSVYAAVPDVSTTEARELEILGATLVELDPITKPEAVVDALRGMLKLCLVVDPLAQQITRMNAAQYART